MWDLNARSHRGILPAGVLRECCALCAWHKAGVRRAVAPGSALPERSAGRLAAVRRVQVWEKRRVPRPRPGVYA